MKAIIEKLDHLGNGICFIDNKVCFVPKTMMGDEVEIEIIKDNKNYMKAKLVKVIKQSENRKEILCPFFDKCGGCQLLMMDYKDTLDYKKDRVKNILGKVCNIPDVLVVENDNPFNYRNKIELKIKDGKLGFYENESHKLIEINNCLVTKKSINDVFSDILEMGIKNGDVTLRCNYNDEILISIVTNDKVKLKDDYSNKKVLGIIVNDKCLYGENHFMENINNYFFDVSYDAFFQVNSNINNKLFRILKDNVKDDVVLDLYSGVGTLSICASESAKKVYAIECIPNAVLNAIKNAKINKKDNINFILGNVEDKIRFIEDNIDTVIVDPPRKGLDSVTIDKILEFKPNKIIYISCDTQSLANNLKAFKDGYKVDKLYALDMFSYSYHTEVVCILNKI